MRTALILLFGAAVVAALPKYGPNRIVGGSVASIQQYPFAVGLLRRAGNGVFSHWCGGTIINNRSVLSAAHCFMSDPHTFLWRHRVGSTYDNSGGIVFNTQQIIIHPQYYSLDMDFAVVRIQGTFSFNNNVQPASIAGNNYPIPDNSPVWVIGWGVTCYWWCDGSEKLHHIQVYTVNLNTCRQRYAERNMSVTNNMLCSGLLDVGGREACNGDSGGPLIHNNVIVGVISWSYQCAHPHYPSVNARVSVASDWIVANILPKYDPNRIVGGSVASIQQYPFAVALLRRAGIGVFSHWCGGTIINNRSVLSAAHCFTSDPHTYLWRHRVGSTNENSGGSVFTTQHIINHPEYNWSSLDMDFAVVRIQDTFSFNNNIQPASIAGTNYPIPDNSPVWAIGWGLTCYRWCEGSQQLQHIQLYTVNLNTCRQRYAERNMSVTNKAQIINS